MGKIKALISPHAGYIYSGWTAAYAYKLLKSLYPETTWKILLLGPSHHVPFYVAAPFTSFDLSISSGKEIPIEERGAEEIINGFGKPTAPATVKVFNPAFDVTPHELITGIITERGVIHPQYRLNIKNMLG